MTGIERLREWADGYAELSKDHTTIDVVPSGMATLLSSIADQIERETKPKSDAVKYASVSAYDPPSQEDREAIAWVREHGGLDAVKRRWECLSYYADPVPRSCMEKRLARLQRQIDESHAALRRRNERIKELNHRACDLTRENAELRKRAMPEGMEWPRYESGEPVRPGDKLLDKDGDWFKAVSFVFTCDWWSVRGYQTEGFGDLNDETRRKLEGMAYGTCVKRPAPKVLDADGVEIRVGDVLYYVDGREQKVNTVARLTDGLVQFGTINEAGYVTYCEGACIPPDQLTHRAPVLAADGRPLRKGETVWHVKTGREYVVVEPSYGKTVVVRLAKYDDAEGEQYAPDQLTHERPDSWERLEEDAANLDEMPCDYSAKDLVRRAKKLAERGQ